MATNLPPPTGDAGNPPTNVTVWGKLFNWLYLLWKSVTGATFGADTASYSAAILATAGQSDSGQLSVININPGLYRLASITASNSASVNFTGFVSPVYDKYIIEILDIVPVTNSVELWMRFSQSGVFQAGTSYSYGWGFFSSAPATGNAGANNVAQIQINNSYTNVTAIESHSCRIELFSLGLSGFVKRVIWHDSAINSSSTFTVVGAGAFVPNTNPCDGVQFLMSSGNISKGTFTLYGVVA